ncbi:MAG: glycosyltransferase family 4 protein, partial [Candidatus Krumholzibacteriia bacterium]
MNTTAPGKRKHRILIISPWKRQRSMGKGAGVADDYRFCKRLTDLGYELHFLSPRSEVSPEFSFESHFSHTYPNFFDAMSRWPKVLRRVLWPALFNVIVTARALVLARRIRPHFVLGHSYYGSLPSYLVREFCAIPSAVKLFGVADLVHTEWPRWRYVAKNLEQIMALKIPQDAWIILDDGTRGDDAARRQGVPADKVHLLPNGINVEWANRPCDRGAARAEFGVPTGALVVSFLSRLVDSKRPQTIVRAAPAIQRLANVPVWFLVAGDGPERESCERLAGDLGVAGRVVFAGALPHERVPDLMAATDVLVATGLYSNMAIPTCEALVCGVPVVAFDTGNTGDVVREGETGRKVRDGDLEAQATAVAGLLNNEEARPSIGRR